MSGMDVKVKGKDYFVIMNGTDISVYEWANRDLVEIYEKSWLMATPYEAIRAVCAYLWEEPDLGDLIAQKLGYELITMDDAECVTCGEYSHYEGMVSVENGEYQHDTCMEEVAA